MHGAQPDPQPVTNTTPTEDGAHIEGQWTLDEMMDDMAVHGAEAGTTTRGDEPAPLFAAGAATFGDRVAAALSGPFTAEFIAAQVGVTTATVKKWAKGEPTKQVIARQVIRVLDGEILVPPRDHATTPSVNEASAVASEQDREARRLAAAEQASEARLAEYLTEIAPAWSRRIVAPELDRLGGDEMLEPNADKVRSHARKVLAADTTREVFGTAPACVVPPFAEQTFTELPEEILHLRRFGRIDYELTLAGRERVVWQSGGRPQGGGRSRVVRGIPTSVSRDVVFRIAAVLDRAGALPPRVIAAFASPGYAKATERALRAMLAHGLVEFVTLREQPPVVFGRMPRVYRLSGKGFSKVLAPRLGTRRVKYETKDTISSTGLSYLAHHIGAASYAVRLLDTIPWVSDLWYTPAWGDGHLDVPIVETPHDRDRKRAPMTPETAKRNDDLNFTTLSDHVSHLKPDAILWLDVALPDGTVRSMPLMVEYDLAREVPYNMKKLLNHEAWRIAILRHHPSFTDLGDHLGATLFVMRDRDSLLALMRAADQGHTTAAGVHYPALTGSIAVGGTQLASYPFRENLYFALEEDLYAGSTRVFQLPDRPPNIRRKIGQPTGFFFHRTLLLPPIDPALAGTQGRRWTGHRREPKSKS